MKSYYPIEVKPLEHYRLLITFDNKEQGIFDVAPYLGDSFLTPSNYVSPFGYGWSAARCFIADVWTAVLYRLCGMIIRCPFG